MCSDLYWGFWCISTSGLSAWENCTTRFDWFIFLSGCKNKRNARAQYDLEWMQSIGVHDGNMANSHKLSYQTDSPDIWIYLWHLERLLITGSELKYGVSEADDISRAFVFDVVGRRRGAWPAVARGGRQWPATRICGPARSCPTSLTTTSVRSQPARTSGHM